MLVFIIVLIILIIFDYVESNFSFDKGLDEDIYGNVDSFSFGI